MTSSYKLSLYISSAAFLCVSRHCRSDKCWCHLCYFGQLLLYRITRPTLQKPVAHTALDAGMAWMKQAKVAIMWESDLFLAPSSNVTYFGGTNNLILILRHFVRCCCRHRRLFSSEASMNPRSRRFSHIHRFIRNRQLCTIASSSVLVHVRYFIWDICIRALKGDSAQTTITLE